jgi:hypothetical protein
MFMSPMIHSLNHSPHGKILGGKAFGRALMNGISALIKQTPENSLPDSPM